MGVCASKGSGRMSGPTGIVGGNIKFKMRIQLLFVLLTIFTACNQQRKRDLAGLWINLDYKNRLIQYASISKANQETNFFASIRVTSEQIEALGPKEIEPVIGRLIEDTIKFDFGAYHFKTISPEEIQIDFEGKSIPFGRLSGNQYKNTFDGLEYLNSTMFIGT